MELLAVVLVFATVFCLIWALAGNRSQTKATPAERMKEYLNIATANLTNLKSEEGTKEKVNLIQAPPNQLQLLFAKYGKQMEAKGYTKQIELELAKADLPLKGYEFIFLVLGTTAGAVIGVFMFNQNLVSLIAAGLIGFAAPVIFLRLKKQQKVTKFNGQIGDALVLISNSLKAGYGFLQAMDMVAREMNPPIQSEFARVIQEINLGITTEEALIHLTERVESQDLDLIVTAMLIQRQTGGNLSEILDNISHTIRERLRIKGEIKSLTAQGRLSGLIIGGLPVAIGLFLLVINPKYIMQLFTDPRGKFMIIYAIVAETIAILIIKKIIAIKI